MDEFNESATGGDKAADADIDARFDPAASGSLPPRGDGTDDGASAGRSTASGAASAQQQLDDMIAACNAWVRQKPVQALAVAAGLGFLLGRVGR